VNRRKFFINSLIGATQCHKPAFAQNLFRTIGGSLSSFSSVWPKEKSENRKYDLSKPAAVVWHTAPFEISYPKKTVLRTVGFVEGASTNSRILYIPGFLVRHDPQPNLDNGFYLYFSISLTYLALPRRLKGNKGEFQERYAFGEQLSVRSNEGIKAGFLKMDFRKVKILEEGISYSPKKEIFRKLNSRGGLADSPPDLVSIADLDVYPKSDNEESWLDIQKTLYFDMNHCPLKFTLELPPMIINGIEVKLPVCYFEPYDILKNEWV
jgi:hypothetical protein